MSNEIITLVKDTSIARIISLQEVIWAGYAFLKSSHGYKGTAVAAVFHRRILSDLQRRADAAVRLGGEEAQLFPLRRAPKCPFWKSNTLKKHFGATRVLNDISFTLEEGRAISIIGSSGSGKTTLLRCLNFLEKPDGGSISVRGETLFDAADPKTQLESEIRKKRLHFGLVFQNFNLFPSTRPFRT